MNVSTNEHDDGPTVLNAVQHFYRGYQVFRLFSSLPETKPENNKSKFKARAKPPLCTRHGERSACNRRKQSSQVTKHPLAEGMLVLFFTPAFVVISAPSSRKQGGHNFVKKF